MTVEGLKQRVLGGGAINFEQGVWLIEGAAEGELLAAAAEITRTLAPRHFDTCSIINAQSGRCSEDCRWCAQSAHYPTQCEAYDLLPQREFNRQAALNERQGVGSFSVVCSGRSASVAKTLEVAERVREMRKAAPRIKICASMGLLGSQQLEILRTSGVERYHCNLETAPSHFPTLCTSHTIEEKLRTLEQAQQCGLRVCSGGIIGMGESALQRAELAFKLLEIKGLDSIPLNILQPISGTPLGSMPPLSDSEILRTIALFRFVHPRAHLRFAGGRAQLSDSVQIAAMQTGINAAIVGDLLTTVGSSVAADFGKIKEAGYEI